MSTAPSATETAPKSDGEGLSAPPDSYTAADEQRQAERKLAASAEVLRLLSNQRRPWLVTNQPLELSVTNQPSDLLVTNQPAEQLVTFQPARLLVTHQPSDLSVNHQLARLAGARTPGHDSLAPAPRLLSLHVLRFLMSMLVLTVKIAWREHKFLMTVVPFLAGLLINSYFVGQLVAVAFIVSPIAFFVYWSIKHIRTH